MRTPGQPEFSINQIRATFIARGSSLARWAKDNGMDPSHVQAAVRGKRKGPKARQLLEQVMASVRSGV